MKSRYDTSFTGLSDDSLREITDSLEKRTITRDDYARLCRWLLGAMAACDCSEDSTLVILSQMGGRVTRHHRMLLRVAVSKWGGVVNTFILDETHPLRLLAARGWYEQPYPLP